MEEGTLINKPETGRKMKIGLLLVSLFIIYYTVMSLLSPGKKMRELQDEYAFRQDGKTIINESLFSDSLYLGMLKEKACFQSKIEMAKTDSVYLSLNLNDSTANLEISGVVVHTALMSDMKISNILRKGDRFVILTMLSSPLTITKAVSSIVREPLMISIAPRDTSEFQPDVIPDTTDSEPVNYILEMQNDVRLYFYQDEKEGRFSTLKFDIRERLINTLASLKSVMLLKVPEYKPYIRVHLPKADAKIIYRALPKQGQVAVCL